ncbi:malto-oligosyltrehalose trehalohydrolase [Geobacter sp. SVR]|uniref:malto-oligosyltrehalose trehalohydrolase n=1 Tax=Geobacter sp. SVR TaxID=2495594 RepID=UPI00143EF8F8|nr:malto-oligosyltrehalose trehalohydrolase [Geobacter sp. SVR]BCS53555.1 malto-oligosyltrehalose trehalohydrolase [Geobacter sp. SVR]GCF84248.1 malto-oligosyltrehalose trehalohydrolase [Geobacter sp. SVR]
MAAIIWRPDVGANFIEGEGTRFRVWAPKARSVSVRILSGETDAADIPLQQEQSGYFSATISGVEAGDRYLYLPDQGPARPDPASRFQPEGVHGASQVIDPLRFEWQDREWRGRPLEEYVIYELHIGTFSREGSFTAAIDSLDRLKDLGITAIELMPVAQFPGERNWGYDGVYPFAPQNSYGGPEGLKRLIDACHARGMAVILDVVYNHLGPEGNYLGEFGFYFTERYRTPWGDAINFDGPWSDPVRSFFIQNALYWINEFHVDALRLDAIHGIYDFGACHFLQQLAGEMHRHRETLGREIHVIAESDLNDARVITPPDHGGYGLDAQWNDDFHHALHALLTGEKRGYYCDFGGLGQLARALREGFVFSGQHSAYRLRRHGNSSRERSPSQFVVFAQNHDQVGNRMQGDRLSSVLPPATLMLAAGVVLTSPYIPLIFMGEEYGETAPFQYFVSHSDPALIEAVRTGRRAEFSSFGEQGQAPDPQAEETFLCSKIDPSLRLQGTHRLVYRFYRTLLGLRCRIPAWRAFDRGSIRASCDEGKRLLTLERHAGESALLCLYNFSDTPRETDVGFAPGTWRLILDSSAPEWGGAGRLENRAFFGADGTAITITIDAFSLMLYCRNYEEQP